MARSPLLIGARSPQARMLRMGLARISVGLSAASPQLGARIYGVPPAHVNATTRLVTRFFAIRNLVLGAWVVTMRTASPADRRRCARLNLLVDAADLVSVAPLFGQRGMRRTAAMAALLAASATAGWLDILDAP